MRIPYTERHGERALERFIADPIPHKPVLLVEGACQVGKTTLVEHVLAGSAKPAVRINVERDSLDRMAFDECRDFAAFQDVLLDRHGFRSNADQVLFIDEAQESRTLGGFVPAQRRQFRGRRVQEHLGGAGAGQPRERQDQRGVRTPGELAPDPALRSKGIEHPCQPCLPAQALPVRHRCAARAA